MAVRIVLTVCAARPGRSRGANENFARARLDAKIAARGCGAMMHGARKCQLHRNRLSRYWHPGCHRCLLKGCEGWFLPRRPQARYCSPACQKAARSWRRWHSCQRFKATDHGKKLRRDQARRYRIRLRQRSSLTQPTPPDDDVELISPVIEPLTSPVIESLASLGSEPPPIIQQSARASAQPESPKILAV